MLRSALFVSFFIQSVVQLNMPRIYKRKTEDKYTPEDLDKTVLEVREKKYQCKMLLHTITYLFGQSFTNFQEIEAVLVAALKLYSLKKKNHI